MLWNVNQMVRIAAGGLFGPPAPRGAGDR